MRLFADLTRRLKSVLGSARGDQRRSVRVSHELLTTIRPRDGAIDISGINRGVSENISHTGVKVRAFRRLPVRAAVELDLCDPHHPDPIRAAGAVVWASPIEENGHWVFGIEFAGLDDHARERLETLVRHALGQGGLETG